MVAFLVLSELSHFDFFDDGLCLTAAELVLSVLRLLMVVPGGMGGYVFHAVVVLVGGHCVHSFWYGVVVALFVL